MRASSFAAVIACLVSGSLAHTGEAAPSSPTYSRTYTDCVTSPNQVTNTDGKERWSITPGCDSYQNEFYERPTTQTYQVDTTTSGQVFAAAEYYQNLDIVAAQAGVDSQYMYVAIDLFGTGHVTESGAISTEGLKYQYHFLLSTSPDGAGGYWLSNLDASSLGTAYQLQKNEGQQDTNGDVGGSGAADGLSITKSDDAAAAVGDGFNLDVIGDGKLNIGSQEVLWSRLRPGDSSVIEFALDYGALGFTRTQIEQIIAGTFGYLDFRAIKGDPEDPQNFMWNDEYTRSEAGSPYRCGSTAVVCGDLTKSEFGTQGLGNIYELDTLRAYAGEVPLPPTIILLVVAASALACARWHGYGAGREQV
jgi:hypothetical protein